MAAPPLYLKGAVDLKRDIECGDIVYDYDKTEYVVTDIINIYSDNEIEFYLIYAIPTEGDSNKCKTFLVPYELIGIIPSSKK